MEKRFRFPPWNLKDVALVIVVVFAGSYGLQIMLQPLLVSLLSLAGQYLFAGLVQAGFFIGTVLTVIALKYRGSLRELGLGRVISSVSVKAGVLGGISLFFLVLVTGAVVSSVISVEPKPQPYVELLSEANTPFEVIVPFLVGGVLAPVGEEIYFRGFAYPVFKRNLGVWGGIILSGVFFSLMHFDSARFIAIAVGGIGLAWLYESTNSLITPIVAHSVWNLSMLGLYYLAVPFL